MRALQNLDICKTIHGGPPVAQESETGVVSHGAHVASAFETRVLSH